MKVKREESTIALICMVSDRIGSDRVYCISFVYSVSSGVRMEGVKEERNESGRERMKPRTEERNEGRD